jgi:diguanylate cyclase (GGDEF)-like protein
MTTKSQKILIVDTSKVIRASLGKHLKEQFAICEETNGDSAWQTLVLDSSIIGVFASHHMPKLDGIGLVERMRENKLSRLNSMPFFMLVSDSFSESERAQAIDSGVSDMIPKAMTNADGMADTMQRLVAQILAAAAQRSAAFEDRREAPAAQEERQVQEDNSTASYPGGHSVIGVSDVMGNIAHLAAAEEHARDAHVPHALEIPGRDVIEERLQSLFAGGNPGQVGVLVFGLDGYELLTRRYGSEVADKVGVKFSGLLARKIRAEDSIGQLQPGRIAILATNTNLGLCTSFAERVCKALAAAQVSVRGRKVDMTVSVGVATVPEDGIALSGQDLLMLADGRLDSAVKAGGNRVISSAAGGNNAPASRPDEFLSKLKEVLALTSPEAMNPYLGNVGLQIMPILTQLEQAFHFGLPIDDMNKRLWARARSERMIL